MKNHNWTNEELLMLEEWDWINRYINAHKKEKVTSYERIRKFMLEAQLIISNKLIIIYNYISVEPVEILSFKEFLTEREKMLKKVEIPLQYHPINFNNIWEYKSYLSTTRIKLQEDI